MRRLLPLALGLACVLVVVLALQNRALTRRQNDLLLRITSPQPGLYVPTASLRSLDGEHVTIGEPRPGGHQVLFVFNTTCQYCLASLPAWESIATQARSTDSGIEVYGVSLDSLDVTRQYVAAHKLSYPTVLFPPGKLPSLYRTRNVPLTMIIDADGRVAYARAGVLNEQTVVDSVVAAMTTASQDSSAERASGRAPPPPATASGAT
jgi:peroxiredoxin